MSNHKIQIKPIGNILAGDEGFSIQIDKAFAAALTNIEGFSHLLVIWWGHLYDGEMYRSSLTADKPYKKGPDKIGIFATRSPVRPNPVLITTVEVLGIDREKGIINVAWIDAENGTPVLDIKPYHAEERVKECRVPGWCDHWPKWYEDSANFDWQNEFNF